MELTQSEGLTLKGHSTLCVWQPGIIGGYLAAGYTIKEAQWRAMADGALVYSNEVSNLITTAGKALAADLLAGDTTTALTYHAIGTGTVGPLLANTTLGTEVKRNAWSSREGSGNKAELSVFYLAADCTYHIREAGTFGGASASATPDSGVLFSRYLQNYDNSAGSFDLTFDYDVTFS